MSRDPGKIYSSSNSLSKPRPPKYPHLGRKIEDLLAYFGLSQSELSRRTGIKQSSLSKVLRGHGTLVEAGVISLSKNLPAPVPLWWLRGGEETGSLAAALKQDQPSLDQALDELVRHFLFFYAVKGEKYEQLRRQILIFGKDIAAQHPELADGQVTAQAALDVMAALQRLVNKDPTPLE